MSKFYPIFFTLLILFIGCQSSTTTTTTDTSSDKTPTSSDKSNQNKNIVAATANMANPASVRCLNDGYQLEPVVENRVTVGHLCVNPETGLKCEEWRYFRDECSLKQDD
ncbi:MAG: DUF333 domain-containing protein [Desulfamplus sp.]|nr:DUF333 domain-containing protein [Desulfamplus sp.]